MAPRSAPWLPVVVGLAITLCMLIVSVAFEKQWPVVIKIDSALRVREVGPFHTSWYAPTAGEGGVGSAWVTTVTFGFPFRCCGYSIRHSEETEDSPATMAIQGGIPLGAVGSPDDLEDWAAVVPGQWSLVATLGNLAAWTLVAYLHRWSRMFWIRRVGRRRRWILLAIAAFTLAVAAEVTAVVWAAIWREYGSHATRERWLEVSGPGAWQMRALDLTFPLGRRRLITASLLFGHSPAAGEASFALDPRFRERLERAGDETSVLAMVTEEVGWPASILRGRYWGWESRDGSVRFENGGVLVLGTSEPGLLGEWRDFRCVPLVPIASGFAIDGLVWSPFAAIALVALLDPLLPLRWFRRRAGRCPRCGQSLHCVTSGVCPECGEAVQGSSVADATS